MTIQLDRVADAVYMKLTDSKITKTVEVTDRLIMDLDEKGDTVGIEILDASSQQELIDSLQADVANGVPIHITENTPAVA